jgi:hypothetical protein
MEQPIRQQTSSRRDSEREPQSPHYGGIPMFTGSDSVCAGLSGHTPAENRPRRGRRESYKEGGYYVNIIFR